MRGTAYMQSRVILVVWPGLLVLLKARTYSIFIVRVLISAVLSCFNIGL